MEADARLLRCLSTQLPHHLNINPYISALNGSRCRVASMSVHSSSTPSQHQPLHFSVKWKQMPGCFDVRPLNFHSLSTSTLTFRRQMEEDIDPVKPSRSVMHLFMVFKNVSGHGDVERRFGSLGHGVRWIPDKLCMCLQHLPLYKISVSVCLKPISPLVMGDVCC
jgi:hypothetical protein